MDLRIHIDGGARGNPGPAGAGVVIHRADGEPLLEAGYYLGRATNNVAEYTALLRALAAAEKLGGTRLEILSDSELMVRQINGEYRVRNDALKGLCTEAFDRLKRFAHWRVRHVRRENNARADELANLAMDSLRDVCIVDLSTGTKATRREHAPASDGGEGAPRESRATESDDQSGGPIVVTCQSPPERDVCPAPCEAGAAFAFTDVTPHGICIHVAPAVVQAVLAVRTTREKATASCPRRGCRARFDVRRGR